ncbi:MAG: hypothetical protein FWG75_09410 [Cystobacterineae bacterium]|nr:hypothetical protein [Cystobacterineae bacterium]
MAYSPAIAITHLLNPVPQLRASTGFHPGERPKKKERPQGGADKKQLWND